VLPTYWKPSRQSKFEGVDGTSSQVASLTDVCGGCPRISGGLAKDEDV
jgi:hypothetical protein